MPMMTRLMRLAKSPHARRLVSEASRYARSPKGRAQLDQVRRQLTSRGKRRR
jgi:hypothetical protein